MPNRSALSMEAMRRDRPLREHARLSPHAPLARPPYPVHLWMRACLRVDCVHTPAALAVMGDYLLRRSGTGGAPGSIFAQKPAFAVIRHAKQLPTPKSDHPRRSVLGFVIRTQPRGCKGVGHTRNFHRAPVRCPASELSALRSIFTNRPPIGLVSRCPVSSLSDTVHLI